MKIPEETIQAESSYKTIKTQGYAMKIYQKKERSEKVKEANVKDEKKRLQRDGGNLDNH